MVLLNLKMELKYVSCSIVIEDADVRHFASTEAEDTDDRPMVCC